MRQVRLAVGAIKGRLEICNRSLRCKRRYRNIFVRKSITSMHHFTTAKTIS